MVLVGTCGYSDYKPGGNWRERYKSKLHAYSEQYDTCELNRTFYDLPQEKTAARWRDEVYDGFVFTLKAWQALTHPVKGVTWRKRAEKLTEEQRQNLGHLAPNREVIEAWRHTRAIASALDATVCVLQTPPSFDCREEHTENMRRLLGEIDRGGMDIAWEPRGDWNDHLDLVEELCNELDIIHIVDPLRRRPRSQNGTCYLRLHGLNPKETDYNYSYSEEELDRLASTVRELEARYSRVYCMFNNIDMHNNAPRLREKLSNG
jgi:uncharacterized protein YecE (DUF72 family)